MHVGGAYLSSVEGFVTGVIIVEEKHVYKCDEEAGSILGGVRSERDPLIKDENDEVAKQAGHKNDFWDESKVDIQRLFKVPATHHNHIVTNQNRVIQAETRALMENEVSQVIEETESDTKEHVDDSQDDGHLHLERIQESQLVDGNVPNLEEKWKTKPSNTFLIYLKEL